MMRATNDPTLEQMREYINTEAHYATKTKYANSWVCTCGEGARYDCSDDATKGMMEHVQEHRDVGQVAFWRVAPLK